METCLQKIASVFIYALHSGPTVLESGFLNVAFGWLLVDPVCVYHHLHQRQYIFSPVCLLACYLAVCLKNSSTLELGEKLEHLQVAIYEEF